MKNKSSLFAIAALLIACVSYQACGEFGAATLKSLDVKVAAVASPTPTFQGPQTLPGLLFWWDAQNLPTITVDDEDGRVIGWQDTSALLWQFGPKDGIGPLLSTAKIAGFPALSFVAADQAQLIADPYLQSMENAYTLVAVYGPGANGRLLNFGATFDTHAIEIMTNANGIGARQLTDVSNAVALTAPLPTATTVTPGTGASIGTTTSVTAPTTAIVIASFGADPGDISLAVNGVWSNAAMQTVGSAGGVARVARQARMGASDQNLAADVGEAMIFEGKMAGVDVQNLTQYLATKWKVGSITISPTPVPTPTPVGATPTPTPAITYAANIAPIMTSSCVSCHSPGGMPTPQMPYLTTYAEVSQNANRVQIRSSGNTMPPSAPFLTASQKALIQSWIDQGNPQ